MSWTHYSNVVAVGVLIAVALSSVGLVAAVSFDGSGVPESGEVGGEMTVNVTSDNPFEDKQSPWTVEADSDLDDAEITIRSVTVGGDVREATGGDGLEISADDGVSEVTVQVSGVVPTIGSYNYDDPDQESVMALEVSDAAGVTMDRWHVHRYTEDSQAARQAIDDAQEPVANSDSESAEDRLSEAIVHYNNGEFDRAIQAAEEAEEQAEAGGELQEMLLILGGVIVIVAIVGGGFFYWKKRQTDTSKLQ